VARDHFGIKPLYYYHDNEYFGFSSELSSFLQVPNLSLEPDPEAIDLYLTYRHIPAPKTIFKQIKKLPPAHFLTLNSRGCVTGPEMFWNPFENRIVMGQKDEWIEELDRMLRDSVQMYMDTADSWGAYITGDLGSLAIMGYISQLTGQPVQTFGIDFNEQNGSLDRILTTSEKNAINLEKIDPCLLDILPSLVKQFDEPYGKIDSIYHYHLSRLSSGVISTALSALSPESSVFGCCPFEALTGAREAKWENHAIRLSDSMNQSTRRVLWRDEYREVCNHSGQFIRDLVSSHLETVNWTLSNRVESGIVPVSLFYGSEKPGNHLNGVNIRMPFLDPRVAEFIIAGSEQIRIISQTNGKDPLKGVMKKIVEKYYPDGCPFAGKPKTDTIQKQWLGDGKALNRVAERLTGKDSSLYPYFRPEAVQELLWQSQSAEPAWLLLFLEEWMKNKKSV
jgi:asparagine synthase (glutamine-hydrolysing)